MALFDIPTIRDSNEFQAALHRYAHANGSSDDRIIVVER